MDAVLINPDLSLGIWKFLESTRDAWTGQWAFRPSEILSEPDWLMHDLAVIGRVNRSVKEMLGPGMGGPRMER